MSSYKHLFRRSLDAAPERLHLAAHSHHLWPDASHDGHRAAWEDAARLADRKWERIMGEIWPAAQAEVAAELRLFDPSTIVFAPNTHELIVRLVSAIERPRPLKVLATDGEFHSFRRQSARWEAAGEMVVERVPVAPFDSFAERFLDAAGAGAYDLIFVSHVLFNSGLIFDRVFEMAELARPQGPWVVIDGYHGFMAVETDLSPVADRVFYTAGGYKYAMAGEGAAFLHCPPGFGLRPVNTGWYAEFDDLSLPPGSVGYAPDAIRFMGSTFDASGLYRFVAVRTMLEAEGLGTAAISEHVARLHGRLLQVIANTALGDAELLNPLDDQPHARFLAFRSPHAQRWQAELKARDVITDVRADVLRIGLGLYNDESDVARFATETLQLGGRE
ncbi:aminotransferase class V-fold PLP-dependent enzyme [Sphingomonas sp.]|uniref:aminotransferase class V-fold PLP-dependent enzyme n=1 Tax=Sphingomonas sp. TaxID=28214 RepID=UPI002DF3B0B0|nr:class V aminotransferase [Sphingomonas sp.]